MASISCLLGFQTRLELAERSTQDMAKMSEKMSGVFKSERFRGALLIGVLALIYLFGVKNLSFGSLDRPGAGFMPFIFVTIVLAMCLYGIVKELLFAGRESKHNDFIWIEDEPTGETNKTRPIKVMVTLIVYPFIIPYLGFFITTAIFLFVILRFMEWKSWWVSLLSALGIAIGTRLLFVNIFETVYPSGIFEWLI